MADGGKRDRLTFDAGALLYECPRCGARPNQGCTKGTGGRVPTGGPHHERVDMLRGVKLEREKTWRSTQR